MVIFKNFTKLGNSDLKVSRVCMGCMGFGDPKKGMHTWTLPKEESIEIIRNGLEKVWQKHTKNKI